MSRRASSAQLGYLDHALSNETLTPQVAGVTEWHINPDEVNLLDYNDTVQDVEEATYDAKPDENPTVSVDLRSAASYFRAGENPRQNCPCMLPAYPVSST